MCSFLLVLLWFLFYFYTLGASHNLVSFIRRVSGESSCHELGKSQLLCWQKVSYVYHYGITFYACLLLML